MVGKNSKMLSARPTRQTRRLGSRMVPSQTTPQFAPKKNLKRKRNVGQGGDYEDEDNDFEPYDEEYEVEVKTSPPKTKLKKSAKSKPASASHLHSHLNTNPHSITKHVLLLETVHPIREALLRWYAGVHTDRGMPWRKKFDASLGRVERAQRGYEVWISEIMLQQTQVATVIPHYNRWMSKFPTIKDLASSSLDTVHALWKGLGYYSRATRLLEGAKVVMRDFGGLFPDNAKDMMKHIPGIGRYSAGAISSIAFGREEPVLDGNTIRLLTRLLALHANPKSKATLDVLWDAAAAMVEGAERPGDVNQALIELGSTICKVKSPTCETCPIGTWCLAREESENQGVESSKAEEKDIEDLCTICEPYTSESQTRDVTIYPMKVEKKKAREETDLVCVVEWRGSKKEKGKVKEDRWFLLARRPEKGLLANLHEFPTIANVSEGLASSSVEQRRVAQELLKDLLSDEETVREYVKEVKTLKGFSAAKTKNAIKVRKGGKDATGVNVVIDVDAEAAVEKVEVKLGIESGADSSILEIESIRPVGDVLHVFSHIRKTYRVLWIVLSGARTEPPRLKRDYDAASTGASGSASACAEGKTKTKSGRKKKARVDDEETKDLNREDVPEKDDNNSTTKMNLRWVKMEDVADANIGTGVMKIWKKVRSLWEA